MKLRHDVEEPITEVLQVIQVNHKTYKTWSIPYFGDFWIIQMHDFAAFSILNSLLSRFVAKPIFATRCGLFDPIPLFFNVFFSKSWWSTAVACTPPISANALHLISAEKWEIFMASHTMLFFRIFRTSMLALCPTPVSENRCHGPTTVGGTSALIAKQNCSLSLQMQWSAIQIRIYMSKLWQAWELCLLRRWLVVQSSGGILFFWLASWAAEGEPSHMECRGWGPSPVRLTALRLTMLGQEN